MHSTAGFKSNGAGMLAGAQQPARMGHFLHAASARQRHLIWNIWPVRWVGQGTFLYLRSRNTSSTTLRRGGTLEAGRRRTARGRQSPRLEPFPFLFRRANQSLDSILHPEDPPIVPAMQRVGWMNIARTSSGQQPGVRLLNWGCCRRNRAD